MLSNLDCSILKELDRQNIKSDVISVVMNRLDTNDKKNDFLSFMIDNRNATVNCCNLITHNLWTNSFSTRNQTEYALKRNWNSQTNPHESP